MSERPLWAPWRIEYITGPKAEECIFCSAAASEDEQSHLVLRRGQRCLLMLNRFPYGPGHLMAAPIRHVGDLEALRPDELADLMLLVQEGLGALRKVMSPDGFNVGINLGKVAGAGIAEHLHLHVVPRWDGDNNFMPVISDTHVVSQSLSATREALVKGLPRSA